MLGYHQGNPSPDADLEASRRGLVARGGVSSMALCSTAEGHRAKFQHKSTPADSLKQVETCWQLSHTRLHLSEVRLRQVSDHILDRSAAHPRVQLRSARFR